MAAVEGGAADNRAIERFGIDRKAKYQGLSALEKAGLVRDHRKPRRNPVVTILGWPEQLPDLDDDREWHR